MVRRIRPTHPQVQNTSAHLKPFWIHVEVPYLALLERVTKDIIYQVGACDITMSFCNLPTPPLPNACVQYNLVNFLRLHCKSIFDLIL